jgi:photosystem II stability/assembly factor-like uncharacterized protein
MRTLNLRIAVTALSVVGLLLLPGATVIAQEGGFGEPFDNPDLPLWEPYGNLKVADGRLVLGDGAGVLSTKTWVELELITQARMTGPGEVLVRTRTATAEPINLVVGKGYALIYHGETTLAETGIEPIPEGEWFTLLMALGETSLRVEINGQRVFDEALPEKAAPGRFALGYQGPGTGEYEFVEVMGLMEEAPTPTEPTTGEEPREPTSDHPPAYQVEAWSQLGGPIGGLGYDIRYSYDDHETWYVTDAWAGIHRSTDRGLTWRPVNEGIAASKGVDGVPIFCVTVDHLNPGVVWIGTEGSGRIYRSADGGDTWVEMSNGIDKGLRPLTFRGITVHPTDPNTLYAMAEISSPAWTPDGEPRVGKELDLTQGIVYKTTDGGRNWVEVWRGDNLARYAWINPQNPDIVYVSTGIFDRESANTEVEARVAGGVGILKTSDGGQNWQVIDQSNGLLDLYVGSLFMHPEVPDTLLAAAAQNNWSGRGERFTGGVFLTHDGGRSWDRVLGREEMYGAVEFCEADPDIAYAASGSAVYRSEDGGQTWERFGRDDNTWGPPGVIAGFPIDMQCDPDDPERIFVNNYGGGNFLSEDGGETWVNASKGYSGALMRQIAVVNGEPGWVYIGGRSGVFRSTDGGETWRGTAYPAEEFSGIPMNENNSLALHPENPLWVLSAPNDLGRVVLSEDGGSSWALTEGMHTSPITIVFSGSDPTIVYAADAVLACIDSIPGAIVQRICDTADNRFFASTDSGRSWREVSEKPLPGDGLTVLVVHPTDPKTVFAGTLTGGFAVTHDGGQTWVEANQGLPSNVPVRTLAIDPGQPEIAFLGYDELSVYKTTDSGGSWRRVSAGLPAEASVRSVVVDPTNSSVVYLGDMRSGVYVSTDGGESWRAINNGLSHRTATALGISDDGTVLYASIEGAGAYRLGSPPPVEGVGELDAPEPGGPEPEALPPQGETELGPAAPEPEARPGLLACPASFLPITIAAGLILQRRRRSEAS